MTREEALTIINSIDRNILTDRECYVVDNIFELVGPSLPSNLDEAAKKAYPKEEGKMWTSAFGTFEFDRNAKERNALQQGYEQAEKETIEKAAKWIRDHWREYILGPDADGCIGFGLWENDFRKAMEEE